MAFLRRRQKVLNICYKKQAQGKGHLLDLGCSAKVSDPKQLKIFTPQQMLQRLPIAHAQVKAGNTSENLPKERQLTYSLY